LKDSFLYSCKEYLYIYQVPKLLLFSRVHLFDAYDQLMKLILVCLQS